MSLFDKIFKRPEPGGQPQGIFQTLTAYTPVFTSWGGKLYESELIRAAINARATHISKLSVEVKGSAQPKLKTKLKSGPNEWQTWGQFLYRLSTILDVNNTAFIVPVMNEYMEVSGVFPVLPSQCQIVQYNNEPWLRYQFRTGQYASIEMKRCGIMTKFQYEDDFFGSDNSAIRPTMELINIQNQGISEAVKSAATFRFMAKMNNFVKTEDLAKERQRFTKENLENGGGGVLLFPNSYSDIKQIESKPFVVDAEQMKMIQTNVYNYFGVNEDILQNKAFGDAWAAFYEGAIEQFSIQFSEVVTKMLFTDRERAAGAFVVATANRLQYMSGKEKLSYATIMGDRGFVMIDEIREVFNLPPLPNGMGQKLPVRGEYYLLGADGSVTKKGDEAANGA